MKINYVIATWNGIRVKSDGTYDYLNTLKNHINRLFSLDNSISQITIMKPESKNDNSYYDIDLKDNIKIIECKNEYLSYGQWLKSLTMFINDFDYHILIEDDYIPIINDFDKILIELYEEGSYLCSLASDYKMGGWCAAVSNGIISKDTIEAVIKCIKYNKWFDDFSNKYINWVFKNTNFQIAFGKYLLNHGIEIKDYSRFYKVDYHSNGRIINYSNKRLDNKERIFTPIQNRY